MDPRLADMATVSSTDGELETGRPPEGDPYLRSAREVTGDAIQARDGALGHGEDGLVDDERWGLRDRVVETRHWWPGTPVLGSPRWIDAVSWTQSSVVVDLVRETIQEGPAYDRSMRRNRADGADSTSVFRARRTGRRPAARERMVNRREAGRA